jgi:hypothetical protein
MNLSPVAQLSLVGYRADPSTVEAFYVLEEL